MNNRAVCILTVLLLIASLPAWAAIGVRISDLSKSPVPPNPIKTFGRVTSVSPLLISDGCAEIEVTGLSPLDVGDYIIVEGDWNGSVLATTQQTNKTKAYKAQANMELIYIPAGTFLMGDPTAASYDDNYPQHSVDLAGYWMGKYEVTRGQFRKFIDAGGYSNPAYWSTDGWNWITAYGFTAPFLWANRTCFRHSLGNCDVNTCEYAFNQTENHPVIGVNYYEAEAFCNWAGCHLPTEAQWERASRWTGTAALKFPWGNTWNPENCNCWRDTNPLGGGDYSWRTTPVGLYPGDVSPCGIMEMAGNAWEWCQDWWKSYPGAPYPKDRTGSYRVIRGGWWYSNIMYCDERYDGGRPSVRTEYNGFRVAR